MHTETTTCTHRSPRQRARGDGILYPCMTLRIILATFPRNPGMSWNIGLGSLKDLYTSPYISLFSRQNDISCQWNGVPLHKKKAANVPHVGSLVIMLGAPNLSTALKEFIHFRKRRQREGFSYWGLFKEGSRVIRYYRYDGTKWCKEGYPCPKLSIGMENSLLCFR